LRRFKVATGQFPYLELREALRIGARTFAGRDRKKDVVGPRSIFTEPDPYRHTTSFDAFRRLEQNFVHTGATARPSGVEYLRPLIAHEHLQA
jgi:hypothetical protein